MTHFESAGGYFASQRADEWRCIRCGTTLASTLDGHPPASCLQDLGGCGKSRDSEASYTYFVPAHWSEAKVSLAIDAYVRPEQRIVTRYKGYFRMDDTIPLEVCLAVVATSRLDGDPLWVYVVGPPSSGKTELLRMFDGLPSAYFLSSLTPNSLVSGLRDGKDLLPNLDRKTLIVKDFTMTLEMHRENRDALFGALRDAYDGSFSKAFGTIGTKRYDSHFNLLAGVTNAIEDYYTAQAVLGQRFLLIRMSSPGDYDTDATRSIEAIRSELRSLVADALGPLKDEAAPVCNESLLVQIKELATEVAILRAHVHRDGYTHEIAAIPEPEVPVRLANTFVKLARGLAFVRRKAEVTDDEISVVRRVAHDTIPSIRIRLLKAVHAGSWTIDEMAQATGLSRRTVERKVEDLTVLGVLTENSAGKPYVYGLSRNFNFLPAPMIQSNIDATEVGSP